MLAYNINSDAVRFVSTDAVLDIQPGETLSLDLASGGHWYGHGFSHVQPYPLETASVANPAFAINNIQCPIWMCSSGVAVLADTVHTLDVRINENGDGRLRIASSSAPLKIRFWRRDNLPQAHAALMQYLGWPNSAPANSLFGDSLFCTWTQYPRTITQERIVDMARQIRAKGYPCNTLIIDDRWESCFGELAFSADFLDPAAMIRELHAMDFKVWLWVTPFVNEEAAVFKVLADKNVLVPRRDGAGAAMFRWWGGHAGLIDVTSPQGRAWMKERLHSLMEQYGVDGFKIDGGDYKYQPSLEIAAWHKPAGESGYCDELLSLFEEIVPNQCESRTAWLSQKRNIIWRIGGKDSHWGLDNGLKATVSLALHLGLLGYDLIIPDMIPGRVQTLVADMPLPTDELMTRWVEANAFMPFMQFSYFPWNYAEPTERIVHAYALVHKKLEDYIAMEARNREAPLLRPIWFDAPDVSALYPIADEFMLGHDVLAAPVLASGVTERDVMLPPGKWVDAWTGCEWNGGLHKAFPAPCPGIPVFVRAERRDLAVLLRESLSEIKRGAIPPDVTSTIYSAGLNRDLSVTG